MKILQAVFSALASLFGSLRFHQDSKTPEESDDKLPE